VKARLENTKLQVRPATDLNRFTPLHSHEAGMGKRQPAGVDPSTLGRAGPTAARPARTRQNDVGACRPELKVRSLNVLDPTVLFFVHGERLIDSSTAARFVNLNKGFVMNKDQVNGTVKDAAGKVQQKTGEVIGSTEQQAKGLAKQVEGKTQKKVGDVKEAVKDASRDADDREDLSRRP
jgi:uncharacterized protein YjbJ (UPF0337 family)